MFVVTLYLCVHLTGKACVFRGKNADAKVTITFSRGKFCVKLCFMLTLMRFYFNVFPVRYI